MDVRFIKMVMSTLGSLWEAKRLDKVLSFGLKKEMKFNKRDNMWNVMKVNGGVDFLMEKVYTVNLMVIYTKEHSKMG